jgi:hypothetical protein
MTVVGNPVYPVNVIVGNKNISKLSRLDLADYLICYIYLETSALSTVVTFLLSYRMPISVERVRRRSQRAHRYLLPVPLLATDTTLSADVPLRRLSQTFARQLWEEDSRAYRDYKTKRRTKD